MKAKNQLTNIPGFYTRREAAEYLGLSEARLAQIAMVGGEMPPTRQVGRVMLYDKAALDRFKMHRANAKRLTVGDELAYTVAQVARRLGMSRAGVHFLIRADTLAAVKRPYVGSVPFRYLILESELERFIAETGRPVFANEEG